MARRKIMRTIRDQREELSSELLRVNPLFKEGFSRGTGINTPSAEGDGTIFEKKDVEILEDCAKGRREDPAYVCGRRNK